MVPGQYLGNAQVVAELVTYVVIGELLGQCLSASQVLFNGVGSVFSDCQGSGWVVSMQCWCCTWGHVVEVSK